MSSPHSSPSSSASSAQKRTNRPVTTAAILLSIFMAAMEMTVIATAMPTVVADLGGLELYGWVGSIYLLGSTVTMPLYGKLADLYGRKPLMLFAITVFLVGSMASGLAHSMGALIAFRGLQALGAGGIQTLAFTVAGDMYTAKERARIQGIFGTVWAVAGMSGPFLGGILVRYLSWRWVFYVNVPVGLIAAVLYFGAFHESVTRRAVRLDLPGAALLASAVIALLLGTSQTYPAITIPLAIALAIAFVVVEGRAAEPVLPLDLLRRRVIGIACALAAAVGASLMSTVTYLPLYMQGILGTSPTEAGSTLAPLLIGWPIASAVTGRILARISYRALMIIGWVFATSATVALAIEIHATASSAVVHVIMFFLGLGLGFANTPVILVVQESVAWQQRGVATAASSFARTIGGSIAIGALGAVLAAGLAGTADARTLSEVMGPEHGRHLDPRVLQHIAAQLEGSLVTIFRIIAAMAAAALALSFLFPAVRLGQAEKAGTDAPGSASSPRSRDREDGALDDGLIG
ncbi:MDR family MFS transporter [Pendulispora albinea]|uniref:MFS transporter n=1 Tax=Pendulispora albinea TaxID=2741071 RepID=A0ABZ2M8A1_9BACT